MNPLRALRSPEHSLLCSPIGLQVLDSFSSTTPQGAFRVAIDLQVGSAWIETLLRPTRTPTGILTLPGLGRRTNAMANAAQQRYRLRIDADEYIAEYRRLLDGFEFMVPPYDDVTPPVIPNANIRILALHPSPNYNYPSAVRVIHGCVREASGRPIRDAMLEFQGLDRAMTDERGEFAFGLRRTPGNGQVAIDVYHDRTGRLQTFPLQLPAALQANQVLALN